MSEKVIAIYCFLDDFLKEVRFGKESNYKVSDAVVLTTAIVAARYFYGNHCSAIEYMKDRQGLLMLDKSAFNRRLHKLENVLEGLFYYLSDLFKGLNLESEYADPMSSHRQVWMDSFPVAVCDNIGILRSRLVKGEEFRGKIASKRRYFYGFRVQVIATIEGLPVQYLIHPGAFVDVTALQTMDVDLPQSSYLYADSGYTDYQQEDYYAECEKIYLRVQRKKNSTRKDESYMQFLKKARRQKIEQTFSMITRLFPKHIHAVTQKGFRLKILLFLLAYSLEQTLK